jgi:signal transduction protein with GAF and PtsI domain
VSAEEAKDIITLAGLMKDLKAATERMAVTNPHRKLMFDCASMLVDLDRLARDLKRQLDKVTEAAAAVLEAEEQRRVELVQPRITLS